MCVTVHDMNLKSGDSVIVKFGLICPPVKEVKATVICTHTYPEGYVMVSVKGENNFRGWFPIKGNDIEVVKA